MEEEVNLVKAADELYASGNYADQTIADFIEEATDDEKYKIPHILFDAVYYDFGQKRLVGFNPISTLYRSFASQSHYPGGLKKKDLFLAQMFEMLTAESGVLYCGKLDLREKKKISMTNNLPST